MAAQLATGCAVSFCTCTRQAPGFLMALFICRARNERTTRSGTCSHHREGGCGASVADDGGWCAASLDSLPGRLTRPMNAGHPVELEPLFGDYPLDQAFDEMREPGGEVRPHYRALAETLASSARRRVAAAQAVGRSRVPDPGHHLYGLRPRRRHGAHLPLRSAAAPGDRRRSGTGSSAA